MRINVVLYNDSFYEEFSVDKLEELDNLDTKEKRVWIDIVGPYNEKQIYEMGNLLQINSLVLRDILEEETLSKYENFKEYLYIAFGITKLDIEEFKSLENIRISFILYEDKLITLRPDEYTVIKDIKNLLKESNSNKLNNQNYVLFIILDAIIDKYYDVLEKIGEYIDILEDELLVNPDKKILTDIYELKRNFIYIRKSLWAIRNMLNSISYGDQILDDKSLHYIKSIYNDVIQIIDLVETYREICSGMLDTYLSSIGNKTNDVMKILTIVSTIFIPISFYSNLFMMNMKNVYSYITFWGLSLFTTCILLLYFRRKGWF